MQSSDTPILEIGNFVGFNEKLFIPLSADKINLEASYLKVENFFTKK